MAKPPRRALGRSGLSVAPFAFGGNVFGWTVEEPTAFALLDRFVDAGFNLIDTADVYSTWVPGHQGGESETMIGRWLRASGRRDSVLLATKVGMERADGKRGLSAAHIRESLRGSLDRLQTDRIDLYQAHVDDPATPLEETLATFTSLREEGLVRAFGASNYSGPRLEAALAASAQGGLGRYESLQPRYNVLDRREYETELEPVCANHGLGVVSYSSLGSGFLTGKYRSAADVGKSPRGTRATSRLDERGLRVLRVLDDVSARLDAPLATVALAWLIARPSVTAPIASATSLGQLEELLAAPTLTLDAQALQALDVATR